jgi:hypothetical protein
MELIGLDHRIFNPVSSQKELEQTPHSNMVPLLVPTIQTLDFTWYLFRKRATILKS